MTQVLLGATTKVQIKTPTVGAKDAEGVLTFTWATGAAIPANLFPKTIQELENGAYMTIADWKCRLPGDTVINHTCTILDAHNREYRVVGVYPHRNPPGVSPFEYAHITVTLLRTGSD